MFPPNFTVKVRFVTHLRRPFYKSFWLFACFELILVCSHISFFQLLIFFLLFYALLIWLLSGGARTFFIITVTCADHDLLLLWIFVYLHLFWPNEQFSVDVTSPFAVGDEFISLLQPPISRLKILVDSRKSLTELATVIWP